MTLASFVRVCSLTSAVLSVAILQSTANSRAQPLLGWPTKNMITPVIVAHGGLYGLCDRRAAKGAAWGANRVGWTINITAAQRPAFDQLLAAVIDAADLSKGTCPATIPAASDEQLLFLERRLESLRQAVAAIRPAFDNFYALLNDEQKARLDSVPLQRWLSRRKPAS